MGQRSGTGQESRCAERDAISDQAGHGAWSYPFIGERGCAARRCAGRRRLWQRQHLSRGTRSIGTLLRGWHPVVDLALGTGYRAASSSTQGQNGPPTTTAAEG